MYIESYWGSYVGGTDDSLTLLSLLEDFEKDEIGLGEIFARTGLKVLEERESSLRMTGDALRFTNREASCEEKEVLRAALSDFADHAKEYDITEVMDETSLAEFREELEALRRELFES